MLSINDYYFKMNGGGGSGGGTSNINPVKAMSQSKANVAYMFFAKTDLAPYFEEMYENGETLTLGDPIWETYQRDYKATDIGLYYTSVYQDGVTNSKYYIYNGERIFSKITNVKNLPKMIIYVPRFSISSGDGYYYHIRNSFESCTELESVDIEIKTCSNYGSINFGDADGLFKDCSKIKEINLRLPSAPLLARQMFSNCAELETLNVSYASWYREFPSRTNGQGLRLLPECYDGMNKYFYCASMFYGCKNLKNVKFDTIYKASCQIGSGTTWGHLLTLESLLSAIQACRTHASSKYTLTIGTANLDKLANVYVKVTDENDTNFYPFEQCESTDEGAMDISTYLSLKNWAIA